MVGRGLQPIRTPDGFWQRSDVSDALRARSIGDVFKLIQRHTGASQTQIGIAVGLSQGQVSPIIRGDRQITTFEVFERIAAGLEMPDRARVLLGLAPRNVDSLPNQSGTEGTRRDRGVRNPDQLSDGGVVVEPRLATAADVDVLRTARNHFERMYRQVGGLAVQPRIAQFLQAQVRPLLDDAPQRVAHNLYSAAGGLVALVGVCAYDADQQSMAEGYFLRALNLARAADNPTLSGYIAGLIANKALRTGNFTLAIQQAEAALADSARLTPALRADLHCTQAEAYASMGDAASTFRQFVAAESAAERINLTEEPPEAGHVQPGVIEGRQAVALRSLGDLAMAETYAARSAELAVAIHPRGQANQLIARATLQLARRDAEAAAHAGLQLVDLTQGMESHLIRRRLADLRKAMEPFRSSTATQSFCEQTDILLRMPL